jgi:hypothetical protein
MTEILEADQYTNQKQDEKTQTDDGQEDHGKLCSRWLFSDDFSTREQPPCHCGQGSGVGVGVGVGVASSEPSSPVSGVA